MRVGIIVESMVEKICIREERIEERSMGRIMNNIKVNKSRKSNE